MPIPYITQETAPASEPLSPSETKLFLRVDNSAEDTLITNLIISARKFAESYTRRSFITQSWRMSFDDYAPAEVELMRGPVQSITSVTLVARDGTTTTVSAATYYLNAGKDILVFDASPISHAVRIIYAAGYGNAASVPEPIKQGMLYHIASMYDKRDGEKVPVPASSRALYDSYKVIEL